MVVVTVLFILYSLIKVSLDLSFVRKYLNLFSGFLFFHFKMYKWLQKLFSTAYLQRVGTQIDGQFCYLQCVGTQIDGRFVIYRVWEPELMVVLLFTECGSPN